MSKKKKWTDYYPISEVAHRLTCSKGKIRTMFKEGVFVGHQEKAGGKIWISKKSFRDYNASKKRKPEPNLFSQIDPVNDPTLEIGDTIYWRVAGGKGNFMKSKVEDIAGPVLVLSDSENAKAAKQIVSGAEIQLFIKGKSGKAL